MADLSQYSLITNDSRKVEAGAIFAAMPGRVSDGRDYIDAAINAGAKMILAPIGTARPSNMASDIIWQDSDNIRRDYADLCAAFYEHQPQHLMAVTGTNGKSSVVSFVRQLLGGHAVSLGTIGVEGDGYQRAASLTTLDPSLLHQILAECADAGVAHLALEASSHGLEQERLSAVRLNAGAFTNLSHDHLDYHETMGAYLAAKLKLFDLLPTGAPAVINADIAEANEVISYAKAKHLNVITYGRKAEHLVIDDFQPSKRGVEAKLSVFGKSVNIALPLVGEFQLYNALCALGLAYAEAAAEHIEQLEKLTPVRGRLELVTGHPKGGQVYVDYAHTPDALATVLSALRPHIPAGGKLIALIGCGGDRDRMKRPIMAEKAGAYADHVIVTDDNPRSEDPAKIRADMMKGNHAAQEISGRADAIGAAVEMMGENDILAVTGKGHEQGQIIGKEIKPFDDVEEVRKAYKRVV